jgi:hypothetical protein
MAVVCGAYQAITGGRELRAIAKPALSAGGHDGRCGPNRRTEIAAATSLDATETNSLPLERARTVRKRAADLVTQLMPVQLMMITH